MAEYEKFKEISLGAFSCNSLVYVQTALRCIERRYPNGIRSSASAGCGEYSSFESMPDSDSSIAQTKTEWTEYACRVSQFPPAQIPSSILHLAQNDYVDLDVVNGYLHLLRPKSLRTQILEVRTLKKGVNEIGEEGLDRPTIIPFRDGDDWVFAVAYEDCIHWYDSRNQDYIPKFSTKDSRDAVTHWTGPKQTRPEDSGIFMLLGIRCIQQGSPHLSQRVADEIISSFRSRVLIELLCGKVDPDDGDFEDLLVQEREEQSLFFNDAINGMNLSSRPTTATPATPPEICAAYDTDTPSPRVTRGARQLGCSPTIATPRPLNYTSPALLQHSRQIFPNDRRNILDRLSEAVLATRSIDASTRTNLAVLWHSMKKGGIGSIFHERYNATLFHDRMDQLRDKDAIESAMDYKIDLQCIRDMRLMQSQCKFWTELCDLRKDWGPGKYTLLLVVPSTPSIRSMRNSQKHQLIEKLRSRLADDCDPLEDWLDQARDICCAIVDRELPTENLMIDVYHLKKHDTIADNEYGAYTSLDPRVKLPLS